jgi:hypothetical protein
MDAIPRTDEKASSLDVEERDVRALTEYLTVLEDVGRVRDAEGLYLVVSQSGREYLVDAEQGVCECEDFRYRDVECKHVRRVAFATGKRAIPTRAAIELDVDPSLGEHVEGEHRYLATDGGDGEPGHPDGDAAGDSGNGDSGDGSWFVRDRDRNKVREFERREAAERAIADLEDLGLDVELVSADTLTEGVIEAPTLVDDRESMRVPARIDPDAVDLEERSLGEDPMEWLPDAFVDVIDGTPAINRKGFEVLAHFYDVDVETEVQVGPADTDHEYCQVKATATMPNGRRCEALASAHVDRGDDPHLLLEMADTRARKRAISIATGVGIVAVEELRNRPEPA